MRTLVAAVATLVVIVAVVVLSSDIIRVASSRIRYEPQERGVSEVSPAQPQGETN